MNLVLLIGHAGQDAEQRTTRAGAPMATFSVATSSRWTDASGQQQDATEWHRCAAFGQAAEYAAAVRRGDRLHVEGSLRTRSYDDRNGVRRESTSVLVSRVYRLIPAESRSPSTGRPPSEQQGGDWRTWDRVGSGVDGQRPPQQQAGPTQEQPPSEWRDGDIPF